jgi:threonine aldolase
MITGAGPQQFASDNYAGVCPQALHWFLEANEAV